MTDFEFMALVSKAKLLLEGVDFNIDKALKEHLSELTKNTNLSKDSLWSN